VLGFVFQWWYVVPIFAVVLFLGAAFGPAYGPFLRLYADVIRPRLAPPKELEDPRPPRFAATVGVAFLTAATVAFAAGSSAVGWTLALIVAALAALAAVTGICVGCEIYLRFARRRGVQLVA
jgi:phosphate/sulfate permease